MIPQQKHEYMIFITKHHFFLLFYVQPHYMLFRYTYLFTKEKLVKEFYLILVFLHYEWVDL
ncbi:Uncharacterised protein [Chlamydia trachomatis]|nr:Uncharacterised protein [Chlamydia trachomatis]